MQQHRVNMYLHDIINAIESIFDYLGDKRDFNQYESNKLLRRAVERELEIIGEATNRIIKIDSTINITNGKRIIRLICSFLWRGTPSN